MVDATRRARLTRIWVVLVVAWSMVRAFIVWRTLTPYGVSAWIYLAIDIACWWPFAISTARLVGALADRQVGPAWRWGAASAVTDLLPDMYLCVAGHGKPTIVYVAIGTVAACFATGGALTVLREIRLRRARVLQPVSKV